MWLRCYEILLKFFDYSWFLMNDSKNALLLQCMVHSAHIAMFNVANYSIVFIFFLEWTLLVLLLLVRQMPVAVIHVSSNRIVFRHKLQILN